MDLEIIDFSLEKLLKNIYTIFVLKTEEKGLDLLFDPDKKIPENLKGDPIRLRQILINLIGNAVKFTHKGRVTLKTSLLSRTNDSAEISFIISDTGIGIPEDQQKNLFQPFVQADSSMNRKFGGTGLGLAISGELVRIMGGKISFKSEPGSGSVFQFSLKFAISSIEARIDDQMYLNLPEFGDIKALLAEDNLINQKVAIKLFKNINLKIDLASNGLMAVEMYRSHPYPLIFMDIQMPEMDGLAATMEIRKFENQFSLKKSIIIALTANAMKGDKEICIAAGMDGYLSKPIQIDELKKTIYETYFSKSIS